MELPIDLPKTEEDPVIVSDELDDFGLYRHFNMSSFQSKRFDQITENYNEPDKNLKWNATDDTFKFRIDHKNLWLYVGQQKLTMQDKETLLNTGEHGWLNSDHIRAASDLLSRQFHEVGGFQDPILAPVEDHSGQWRYNNKFICCTVVWHRSLGLLC